MDSNNEEPDSWMDRYKIDLIPKQLFFKFRKEIEGIRMGLNLEFYNAPSNEFQTKLVLKPLSQDRRWKFIYEPLHHDVQLYSKKIPLTKYLNIQVGVAHSFQMHQSACKWKFSTCLGGDGFSLLRNKTSLDLFPGIALRFGWKAEYESPEVHGGIGTGESMFNMNSGRLNASLDRLEAILTHTNFPAQKMDVQKKDARETDALKLDAQKMDAQKMDARKPDTD